MRVLLVRLSIPASIRIKLYFNLVVIKLVMKVIGKVRIPLLGQVLS